jgi:thiamine-phosphate pyrophosphorylase
VYALGGMNLETIKAVKDLGFGGIVISGDLWNRFNIHQELEYQALIDHFCKIRKAIG